MVDLKAGGIDAALATAKQFRDQDHDFLAARALIGDAYEAANRPADAVEAYQEALAAAPSQVCWDGWSQHWFAPARATQR